MIEPINFMAAFRRSWRLIVALVVVFAVVAVVIPSGSSGGDKKANAATKWQTRALVGTPPGNGVLGTHVTPGQIVYFGNTAQVKLAAYNAVRPPGNEIQILNAMGTLFLTGKLAASGGAVNLAEAAAAAPPKKKQTGSVTMVASAKSPQMSANLTNAYVAALTKRLKDVAVVAAIANGSVTNAQGAAAISTAFATVFPALASQAKHTTKVTSSITASHKVRLVIGVLIGLILAAGVIILREILDKRLRLPERAAVHFKFPVIAEIPNMAAGPGAQLSQAMVLATAPNSPTAEAYRKLRMSILFEELAPTGARLAALSDPYGDAAFGALPAAEPYEQPSPDSRQVILVVSPADEPSRPEVVANLAAAYAEAGQRVIVSSTGDLDSGVPVRTELRLTGPVSPDDVRLHLQPSRIENVSTLSFRPFVRNGGQLVGRGAEVLDVARQVADVVIVEAPPFLEFHHGEALVHAVDVVLVVGESGRTDLGGADDTGDLLRRLGAPVLGVVFTRIPVAKKDAPALPAPALMETGTGTGTGTGTYPTQGATAEIPATQGTAPGGDDLRDPAPTQA